VRESRDRRQDANTCPDHKRRHSVSQRCLWPSLPLPNALDRPAWPGWAGTSKQSTATSSHPLDEQSERPGRTPDAGQAIRKGPCSTINYSKRGCSARRQHPSSWRFRMRSVQGETPEGAFINGAGMSGGAQRVRRSVKQVHPVFRGAGCRARRAGPERNLRAGRRVDHLEGQAILAIRDKAHRGLYSMFCYAIGCLGEGPWIDNRLVSVGTWNELALKASSSIRCMHPGPAALRLQTDHSGCASTNHAPHRRQRSARLCRWFQRAPVDS